MVDQRGKALVQAARSGKEGRVRQLLENHVDPNYRDASGYTALHCAAVQPNGLGVLITLLRSNKLDINKRNRVKRTALILAAGKGNYFAVQHLLQHHAKVAHQDMWRWNALDYADKYGHTNIATLLRKAGATPTTNKRKEVKSIPRQVAHQDTAETMLCRLLEDPNVKINSVQLMNVVCESKISNMRLFLCSNYLLHLLKKFAMPELNFLQQDGAKDYILANVYYRATELRLSEEEKALANKAAEYAQDRELIRPGKAVDVRKFMKVEASIRYQRDQLQKLSDEVLHKLLTLDNRLYKVEAMSSAAVEQLHKLADNDNQIIKHTTRMRDYLNELHCALKKKEKRDKYVAIARFLLSTMPIFGNVLGNAAYATADVFFGLTDEKLVDIGTDVVKGGISFGLGVDLSDSTSVGALTSGPFLCRLNRKSRQRMEFAAQESKFRNLKNISKELEASMKTDPSGDKNSGN